MIGIERLDTFFTILAGMATHPANLLLLFGATLLGIIFGALPGLTATLGIALLTTLTYGMGPAPAMVALLGIYVGGVYGGSYASILINIPGTPAAAATALEGYPLACKGEAGRAIGATTTASCIGTLIGMLFMVTMTPIVSAFALQFTSFEFFLLAFFGIIISGTLASPDLAIKGWISGFLGLFLACMGRDPLQAFPRFTFGFPQLESGLDVVAVIIGAFGIPQIIQVLGGTFRAGEARQMTRVMPSFGLMARNTGNIIRSASSAWASGPCPASARTWRRGWPTGRRRTPRRSPRNSAPASTRV